MNPTQLRTFLAVTAAGSFSRAARTVHMSQSTASLHVRELEESLGVQLLQRTATGVTPTAAGRLLLDYGSRMLDLEREATAKVRSAQAEPSETLVLAACPLALCHLLPTLLARIRAVHPRLKLVVWTMDRERAILALRAGECDVALVDGVVGGMVGRCFAVCEVVLVASPDLALDEGDPQPWIVEPPGTALGAVGAQVAPTSTPAMVLDCPHGVRRCAIAGHGVALVDRAAVAEDLEAGRLRTVPWPGTPTTLDLWLVRSGRAASPAVEALFEVA